MSSAPRRESLTDAQLKDILSALGAAAFNRPTIILPARIRASILAPRPWWVHSPDIPKIERNAYGKTSGLT